jgi:hypothetical protein
LQDRQVQRGVGAEGAAPGVDVVVAFMDCSLHCGGALLLRARVVPRAATTANNCKWLGRA